jgi:sialidase-1
MTTQDSPAFEACLVDVGTRFPNLIVGTDGTVILTHGGLPDVPPKPGQRLVSRRSTDGGASWEDRTLIQEPAIQGGGMLVDDATGAIFAFCHREHVHPRRPRPPYPAQVHRSTDQGRSWQTVEATFQPDVHGNVPALHMAEHGIALHHGAKPGRLIRAARVWDGENAKGEFHTGYNTALFSDDGGRTWIPSAPFPSLGTGEGAIAELRDGTLLYSSRKQYFHDGQAMTSGRWFARSRDAGETWEAPVCQEALPDGPRYRGSEKRGCNYNGHYGILAGLTRVPDDERDILLYTSPDTDGHERKDLTVWVSFDGGRTWPVKRLLFQGPAAYSTIVAGCPGTPSEGWIYCAFEGGVDQMYEGVRLVRFNRVWLEDKSKKV